MNGLTGMRLMRQFVGGVSMGPILCLCREDYQEGMKDFMVPLIHLVSVYKNQTIKGMAQMGGPRGPFPSLMQGYNQQQ